MKLSKLLIILTTFFVFSFTGNNVANISDCSTYFPLQVGMKWTMKSLNKKGKETGRNAIEVMNAKALDGGTTYLIKGIFDSGKKGEVQETNFEYSCKDNILTFNMDQFFASLTQEVEGMEIDIQTDGMEVPNVLEAGQTLKSAKVTVATSMNGMKIMNITVSVTDRKVEGFEKVTTEAGTYNCAKITAKVTADMGIVSRESSSTTWLSDKVGVVKTEDYDKNGKLVSGTELAEFSE